MIVACIRDVLCDVDIRYVKHTSSRHRTSIHSKRYDTNPVVVKTHLLASARRLRIMDLQAIGIETLEIQLGVLIDAEPFPSAKIVVTIQLQCAAVTSAQI